MTRRATACVARRAAWLTRSWTLTAEDAKEMAAKERRFHWDKRHKRYVQLQAGEKLRSTGKRKTESGATVRRKPVRMLLILRPPQGSMSNQVSRIRARSLYIQHSCVPRLS